ncbi:MAG: hypothetical protein AAF449_00400 [Myxococcota bacterium]
MNAAQRRPSGDALRPANTDGYEVVVVCNTGTRRYPAGCIREARSVRKVMLAMWATAQPTAQIFRLADGAAVQ